MNKYFCQHKKEQTAHWSRFPVFVQQLFFSRFLANFDAQYGKIRVFFGVEEFIFGKNIGLLLAMEHKLTNEIPKFQLFKNNL